MTSTPPARFGQGTPDSVNLPPPPGTGSGGWQSPPGSGDVANGGQVSPYLPYKPWRDHACIVLTIITLVALGIVLLLTVAEYIWAPWQLHAFQATTDGEMYRHVADIFFSIFLGIPLAVIGVVCGHFAVWLVSPESPRRTRPQRRVRRARRPLGARIGDWVQAAGTVRFTVYLVLVAGLTFGYFAIIMQVFYAVWRLFISIETI